MYTLSFAKLNWRVRFWLSSLLCASRKHPHISVELLSLSRKRGNTYVKNPARFFSLYFSYYYSGLRFGREHVVTCQNLKWETWLGLISLNLRLECKEVRLLKPLFFFFLHFYCYFSNITDSLSKSVQTTAIITKSICDFSVCVEL